MTDALITPYATLSFPHLFSPKPRSEGGEPVYSCSLLFAKADQKTPEYKALQNAVVAIAKEKFGDKIVFKSLNLPFRDGAEKADKYAGYDDEVIYVTPWSKFKPGIVDIRLQDVIDPEEVYAGQIVRAHVLPFAWSNAGKRGVSFGLNHIQLIKRNTPRIDGRTAASNVFSAVEGDEGDDDAPF
jgi:hypothetical protein